MNQIEQVATRATFGSVWAVLAVGHNLADHGSGRLTTRLRQGGALGGRGRRRHEPRAGAGMRACDTSPSTTR
jgi:hypothetical protein